MMGQCGYNHLDADEEVLQFLRQYLVVVLLVRTEDVLDHFEVDQHVDDHALTGGGVEERGENNKLITTDCNRSE